jgi:hypothetical protein
MGGGEEEENEQLRNWPTQQTNSIPSALVHFDRRFSIGGLLHKDCSGCDFTL